MTRYFLPLLLFSLSACTSQSDKPGNDPRTKGQQQALTPAQVQAQVQNQTLSKLSAADHLKAAQKLITDHASDASITLAKKHLSFIPAQAPEFSKVTTMLNAADVRLKKLEKEAASMPKFRTLPQRLGYPISIVVVPATTDKELENLLRFIRERVQKREFKNLGIAKGTSPKLKSGEYDYGSGMFLIFRGDKCATENFFDELVVDGPCGYGDHYAASYHWGIHGDFTKDDADIVKASGPGTVFQR